MGLPLLLLAVAACGGDGASEASDAEAPAGDAQPAGEMAAGNAPFGDDFEDRACEHFTEEELRQIFEIPEGVEVERSGFMPCGYGWTMALPDRPDVTPEFTAGISYVVTVADDAEAASRMFESVASDRSEEEMTAVAEDAAEDVAEDADLSSEQEGDLREAAGDLFGEGLSYERLQGVGDRAAWEGTHGSLVVLSGNLVFRTVAESAYWDRDARGVERQKYPNLAAEVARATLN